MFLNNYFHADKESNKAAYDTSDDEVTTEFISRRNLNRLESVSIEKYSLLLYLSI